MEAQEKKEDVSFDTTLRPKSLDDYVWQSNIKKHLSVSIASAKIRMQSFGTYSFLLSSSFEKQLYQI